MQFTLQAITGDYQCKSGWLKIQMLPNDVEVLPNGKYGYMSNVDTVIRYIMKTIAH